MTLLGEIVEKDGAICLQTAPNVWYPLEGQSGIAEDFRDTFNGANRWDIGRQVHCVKGVLYMEAISDGIRRRYRENNGELTQVCGGCDLERTREALKIMRELPDNLKSRFAINWKIPHTLFNVASTMPDHFPMDRFNDTGARVDWFTLFELRDLGTWAHGGRVFPQSF